MEVRNTSKSLIACGDNKFLFVANRRGRWNLPGGGIDEGETTMDALKRELREELGDIEPHLTDAEEAFTITGITTSAEGIKKLAHWTVFRTALLVPWGELVIPNDSEVAAINAFTAQESANNPQVYELACRALQQAA